ncbi:YraN family protein [Vulcanibacillus modesticaldus]|uniref:UPF0102 protein BHF71_00295 n=1 Tax=Vulcanibacillus modesticaldus TaxID=337097 RepID=A0A1D2YXJ6_9BACI|nr:YraN family protein [Vulcanibacillus modesticaldus]OEG00383.1 YraN family protein [Vulcanibacillus modesticaldus]
MPDKRKALGNWGEDKAVQYLLAKGYKLIVKNWRNRFGEIDLIMLDKECIVFIEVRTKNNSKFGKGLETINHKKQQQLVRMANAFLQYKNWWDNLVRFDIISIDKIDGTFYIKHLENVIEL